MEPCNPKPENPIVPVEVIKLRYASDDEMVGASNSEEGNGSSTILSQKKQRSPVSSGDGAKEESWYDARSGHSRLSHLLRSIDDSYLPACSSCSPKLRNKCPACALPIGHIRNRAMETVLESTFVPCRNAELGCTKKFTYGKESAHEKECNFSPCSCPVQDCDYTGSVYDMEHHYVSKHKKIWMIDWFNDGRSFTVRMNISDKIQISREASTRLLFPVQCFREPYGVYVTVSCIAPPSPEVGEFSYDISYTTVDGHTLTYNSPEVKRVLEVSFQTPQENFMLIPNILLRGDLLDMKMCIKRLGQE